MELSQRDFEAIRDMVYQKTGMMFEDRKRLFVQARIAKRLPVVGCEDPRDYYRYLRYQDTSGEEFQKLIELLTTNETYFFREFPQLECFANEALPQITEQKALAGDYQLNLWSAACSTGDEPYTLAIILRACLEHFEKWQIRIVATDIDTRVLGVARQGVYSQRAVKDVPDVYLREYFHTRLGRYHVVDEIKQMVEFAQVNLLDRKAMRAYRGFDFIFCRNVLIYFDDAARRKVLSSFYDSLVPGGYIFLGHSESVGRISAAFEMVSLGGQITYRKPLQGKTPQHADMGDALCATR